MVRITEILSHHVPISCICRVVIAAGNRVIAYDTDVSHSHLLLFLTGLVWGRCSHCSSIYMSTPVLRTFIR